MSIEIRMPSMTGLALLLSISVGLTSMAAAELMVDGDFENCASGSELRKDNKGQDWMESRGDGDEGKALLKLSTKDIGGNATRKAMIKGDPELNTYLTQRFKEKQAGDFSVQYDVYVREILGDDNRSAFCLVGASKDKKRGPNSTRSERFVFLAFENAAEAGRMNLVALEGDAKWENRTVVARDVNLKQWYTVVIEVYVEDKGYDVWLKEPHVDLSVGEKEAVWTHLDAVQYKGKTLKKLSHVSFASWNDGAGTFYIDNVTAERNYY